ELNTRIVAAQGALDMAQLNLERIGGTYEPSSPGYYGWNYRTALLQRDPAKNALDVLLAIRDNPLEINAAVDQAYAAYQTAIAAVKTAERQVEQAEASLQVIIVQLGKLTASSPISGIVADRFAEPGEIAQPGIPVLKIIELSEVTLTAYVPESKIGLVKLGQTAVITVDSYPGQDFAGKVIHISSQAQFTPKNIQMKEEREKTVFAVKIELPNPEQKLKPGMPADARILTAAP
ncbi:MAG: efflux RND transporter periplasmic adaptor subunit, partial [Kiritimatiellota bacterium]|nr:efflux RND transporter periplasmic adaptor subunit [Kiritimatiellota bacterium]